MKQVWKCGKQIKPGKNSSQALSSWSTARKYGSENTLQCTPLHTLNSFHYSTEPIYIPPLNSRCFPDLPGGFCVASACKTFSGFMRKAMLQPVLRVQGLTKDFTLGWFGQEWNIKTANLFEKAFFSCIYIYIFFCEILSARNLNTLSVQHDIKTDQMTNIFMTNLKD